jgi:hypothetical protein
MVRVVVPEPVIPVPSPTRGHGIDQVIGLTGGIAGLGEADAGDRRRCALCDCRGRWRAVMTGRPLTVTAICFWAAVLPKLSIAESVMVSAARLLSVS